MKKIAFLTSFVRKHRVAISVGVTSTVFVALIMRNQAQLNAFLKEHNLLDEFYSIGE